MLFSMYCLVVFGKEGSCREEEAVEGPSPERASHFLLQRSSALFFNMSNEAHMNSQDRRLGLALENAANEEVSEDTAALLRSFRPCKVCDKHRRVGEQNDGGYVMCEDDLKLGTIQAAYSYGISGYDGWGNQISREFQIPVFEYDCTNPKRPKACSSCDLRFNSECIAEETATAKERFGTLSQHMKRNGHDHVSAGALLLKIDIEGAEWPILAEEPTKNLKKFREIVIEFHNLKEISAHPLYLRAVRNIMNAGFVVDHIHGNNCCEEVSFGSHHVPNVLEVTYLQRPNDGTSCMPYGLPLTEDAANLPHKKELPAAQLA